MAGTQRFSVLTRQLPHLADAFGGGGVVEDRRLPARWTVCIPWDKRSHCLCLSQRGRKQYSSDVRGGNQFSRFPKPTTRISPSLLARRFIWKQQNKTGSNPLLPCAAAIGATRSTSEAVLSDQPPLDQHGNGHGENTNAPGRAQQLVQQDSSCRNHGHRSDSADSIDRKPLRRH